MRVGIFAQFYILVVSVACGVLLYAQPVGDVTDWDSLVSQFVEDHLRAHPLGAAAAGRHDYDGQFPDWSREGIRYEIERLRAWQDVVAGFEEEQLTRSERFQKSHLLAILRAKIFWLDRAEQPFRNPAFYFDRADSLDPSGYVMRDYAPPAERMVGLTEYLENLPAALRQIGDNLQGALSLPHIDYGVVAFGGLAAYIRSDLESAFQDVGDENLIRRFDSARFFAAAALDELVQGLEEQRASASDEFALGPELFREMLRETEMIDLSLDQLARIGADDLERNLSAVRDVCQVYARDVDLGSCMARMRENKPEGDPIEAARGLLSELRSHVEDHELLTIPPGDPVRIEEAPAFARANLAYLMPTGPFEEKREAIFYLAAPDPSWSPQVQRDYLPGRGYLVSATAHETLPGHYAHVLRTWASASTLEQMFYSVLFVEGWAHYAEELLVETGMREDDLEFRLGQLSWALQRNVRFLCSLGLHAQGMTVAECESKFRDEAFQDEGTARQQAIRGTYDPMYLSYTLGKLRIQQFRAEWVEERGGRDAWKDFHDTFLSYGMAPIPLIRQEMQRTGVRN